MDPQAISNILNQNSDKNFVQRILNPDVYPKLDLGNGNYATHKMAWTNIDNGPIVFPTVIQQGDKLQELPIQDAIHHALKSGEFIPFKDSKTADDFSQQYKKVWNTPQSIAEPSSPYQEMINLLKY